MTAADLQTPTEPREKKHDFNIRRRRAAETRFKMYGIIALCVGIGFLGVLLYSIISKGYQGFVQANIKLEVNFDPAILDPDNLREGGEAERGRLLAELNSGLNFSRFGDVLAAAVYDATGVEPTDSNANEARLLLTRSAPASLRRMVLDNPELIGTTQTLWFPTVADADSYLKGIVTRATPEARRQISDFQLSVVDRLAEAGVIEMKFNTGLFVNPASKRPESAGLIVAIIGSLQMMLIVLGLALVIGVAASIYLEEFAPKNRLTDVIEVNINNLAAVPSIVFGILGLAVFINFMEFGRSTALVGGLVLTLMTLPTIIIATRASLRAVPPSIRQAALGVGASKMQSIFHHVLPLALPGILTGTIIGLAQALGETAPLLLVGMDAFVQRLPGILDVNAPATSLPSQIYQWAREDDRTSFDPRTSAAIMVLLGFLAIMNLTAVFLRRRFERRW